MGEGGDIRRVFWTGSSILWGLTEENHFCEYRLSTGKASFKPVRVVTPAVKLDFEVDGASFRPDGKFAVLFGYKHRVPHVAVVDLVAYRASSGGADDVRECECRVLARDQVVGCPGVRIRRVRFFPFNGSQFGILGSNNRWVVYDANNLDNPVRTFKLEFLGCGGWGKSACVAVDFDLGAPGGWGAVSVFFLAGDGKVFLVCPLPLPKLKLPLVELQAMEKNGTGLDRAWCGNAFLSRWTDPVVSQDLPEWWKEEPLLQGPLNVDPPPIDRYQDPAVEMAVIATDDAVRIIVITNKGVVTEYFWVGDVNPRWSNPGLVSEVHCPMLAPHVIFRQGDSMSPQLLTVSQASFAKTSSCLKGLSVCPGDGSTNVLVVRDDGIFSVGFPPLTQDYDDQSTDFDSVHSRSVIREDPIIECLHRGSTKNGWAILNGFFLDGRTVIVGGEGRSLVMTVDVGTECPSPSATKNSLGSHTREPVQALTTVDSLDSHIQSVAMEFQALEASMSDMDTQLGAPGPSEGMVSTQMRNLDVWLKSHEGTMSVVRKYNKDIESIETSLHVKLSTCGKPSEPELDDIDRLFLNVTKRQNMLWKELRGVVASQEALLEQRLGS